MSRADQRGWGPGWPNCQADKLVTVEAGGIRVTVRNEVAAIVRQALTETAKHIRLDQTQTGAFNCRKIARTTSSPSNHSWGLAIDINWRDNPVGGPHKMPPAVVDIWAKYGWTWGGLWATFRDYMHFEFSGSPYDALLITRTLTTTPGDDDDMTPDQATQLAQTAAAVREIRDRTAALNLFQPHAVRPIGREEVYVVVDGGTGRRWVQNGDLMANLLNAFPLGLEEWNLEDVVAIPVIGDESPGMAEFLASR